MIWSSNQQIHTCLILTKVDFLPQKLVGTVFGWDFMMPWHHCAWCMSLCSSAAGLQPVELVVSVTDVSVCLSVSVDECRQTFSNLLLLPFLSVSHETWHVWSMCQYAKLEHTLNFDKLQCAKNNLARVVCQSWCRTDARPLLHSLHWLPVRLWVTYKLALLTHKVRTTATPTYLSELVQTRAPPRALRSSDARRSSHTHRTGPSRFFCCCSIHLELSTCWHSTVR